MLTPEELEIRKSYANASEAGIITGTDAERQINLYLEKIGHKEPDDLTWVQPVQFGVLTEPFNIALTGHKLGKEVTALQQAVISDEYPWMRATLDGMVDGHVLECKCVSAFAKPEEQQQKYYPQVQQQMLLTGAKKAYLSIFFGTLKHEIIEVEADAIFQSQLADVTRRFMECVKNRVPPASIDSVHVPIAAINRVDMSGSNEWGNHAAIYTANYGYAKQYDLAVKELKALTPADAFEAYGAGVRVTRSKTGSLTIRKEK
jgi:putative phage-type endonuclease